MDATSPDALTADQENAIRKAERRQALAEIVEWVKRLNPCLACGVADTVVLDFHHLDPDTKVAKVSRLVSRGATLKALIREILACAILCANCHRRLHAGVLALPEPLKPVRVSAPERRRDEGQMPEFRMSGL